MSNLRFSVITILLFAGAFASMAWASKGFPLPGFMSASVEPKVSPQAAAPQVTAAPVAEAPAQPKVTHEIASVLSHPNAATVPLPAPNPRVVRAPAFEDSVKEERKELAQPKSVQPSKPAQREPELPADTDPGRNQVRLTAIQAASAYAYAPCDPAIKAAFVVAATTYIKAVTDNISTAGAFATPMDRRVRASIQAAFVAGGITSRDFPTGTQTLVAAIAKTEGTPNAPCSMGRQADRSRRDRS
ncbi:MAG: hypothetical protein AB1490_01365 [Pseudomonadota bacterium]